MKYLLTALLTILTLPCAFAQVNDKIDIDYNKVEVNVLTNRQHYQDQLQRYIAADTTMRLDEIALVYYGYPSTLEYDPTIDYSSIRDQFAKKEYKKVLEQVREALPADPVNLDLIVMGALSASKVNSKADAAYLANLQNRFNMLVTAIMASGSGVDVNSPFKIIRAADAMVLMRNVIGITDITNDAQADNIMAYVFRLPQSQRDNILYFDITPQQKFLSSPQ